MNEGKKTEELDAENDAGNLFVPEHETDAYVDRWTESVPANGATSEAALEAEISAQENPRADYLDGNGNSHLFDEGEEIDVFDNSKILQMGFLHDNAETFRAIDDYLEKGIRPKGEMFSFSGTPEILQFAGIPDNTILFSTKVINKARNTHNLSNEEIKSALINIASPILVFDSDISSSENKQNSVLLITDAMASSNKPLAVTLNMNADAEKNRQKITVNKIRSIHDRTLLAKNGTDLIQKWTGNGLCRYVDDKKISEWQLAAGEQFPLAVLHSDNFTIKTYSDFVKMRNPQRQEFQEAHVNLDALKRFPYEMPESMKRIEAEVLQSEAEQNEEMNERIERNDGEDLTYYYEKFSREAGNENETVQIQKAIALSLDKNVSPLQEVKLNRENWNKLFPDGTVETPVATVKLGENQFAKLQKNDRSNLLAAMYETLSNPAIVLEKETLDEKTGEFRPMESLFSEKIQIINGQLNL